MLLGQWALGAEQAEFKWFDKPRDELEYVLDARGGAPHDQRSTPKKKSKGKSGASSSGSGGGGVAVGVR